VHIWEHPGIYLSLSSHLGYYACCNSRETTSTTSWVRSFVAHMLYVIDPSELNTVLECCPTIASTDTVSAATGCHNLGFCLSMTCPFLHLSNKWLLIWEKNMLKFHLSFQTFLTTVSVSLKLVAHWTHFYWSTDHKGNDFSIYMTLDHNNYKFLRKSITSSLCLKLPPPYAVLDIF
jgi:hypothetical protein